jgi:hypothetical protein
MRRLDRNHVATTMAHSAQSRTNVPFIPELPALEST